MTKTTISDSRYGIEELVNGVAEWTAPAGMGENALHEFARNVVAHVNKALPGSYEWAPDTSEILHDKDETEPWNADNFEELVERAFMAVDAEWDAAGKYNAKASKTQNDE